MKVQETVYTRGVSGEMPEIVDFINYVFSQAHVPHDFKTLLPKVYGDEAIEALERFHFLAKQNGRIVACVACRPTRVVLGGSELKIGYIGSVSVHPYHRGEGHMKRLMQDMLADAKAQGYDMLVLGGQRQRYGYFGFDKGGLQLRFEVTRANVRHALSGIDDSRISLRPFEEADAAFALRLWQKQPASSVRGEKGFCLDLRSWNTRPSVILDDGKKVGYIAGKELILEDESLLPEVVKMLVARSDGNSLSLRTSLMEKRRIAFLKDISEYVQLTNQEMLSVLSWERVLKTLLELKHKYVSPVEDGKRVLDIADDGVFEVVVRGGEATVTPTARPESGAVKLTHLEAQRMFFGVAETFADHQGLPASWLMLPFFMSEQDGF